MNLDRSINLTINSSLDSAEDLTDQSSSFNHSVEDPKICVWLLIGIPASGKTTLARQLQRSHPRTLIISPDQIRNRLYGSTSIQGEWTEIWQAVKTEFSQAYNSQHSVIYDATNCHRPHRQAAIALAKSAGFKQVNGLWLQEPLWICLIRNQRRNRQVPEEVVISMHRDLQDAPPQLQEGFDTLLYPKQAKESEWMD